MDHNWDTNKLRGSDLTRAIVALHLVAYYSQTMEEGYVPFQPTNHWCLFLEFGNGKSVRLEVVPGSGSDGLRAQVRLTSRAHPCTSNYAHKVTYDLNSGVCLEDLVQICQTKGRQRYEFAEGWEGCRYWNYVFIKDLESSSILPRGATDQARDAMSYFYHSVYGVQRRSMKKGTFRV
ncbi:hypothetical protein F5Y09DRAFT_341225 [Xylaria sp. FL1042]|nr:hypothetical protein F5Y09DRAFT_341225 [Xylaria sp. FL1042]